MKDINDYLAVYPAKIHSCIKCNSNNLKFANHDKKYNGCEWSVLCLSCDKFLHGDMENIETLKNLISKKEFINNDYFELVSKEWSEYLSAQINPDDVKELLSISDSIKDILK